MASWKIGARIGGGGFCEVFEATRAGDTLLYAQKLLPAGSDNVAISRFQREARILSTLVHPNIVTVVGKRLGAPPYFFVMPRFDCSLEDILSDMPNDEERLIKIFGSVIDAVEYAHTQGILHRDLKPANILIRGWSDIAVSDFGLGRDLSSESDRDTRTMQGLGSAAYAPPEQFRGAKDVDKRADVFALGRVLYAMLTGEPPVWTDLSNVLPKFGIIIGKCTRPDPDNRYQDVSSLKSVWLAATRTVITPPSPDKIRSLAATLAVKDQIEDSELTELLGLLLLDQDDEDLVKEVLLILPILAIKRMYELDGDSTRHLIMIFVNVVLSTSWPFSHTDVLADSCQEFYDVVEDPEARARIVAAVLHLGWAHSRWHVLSVFGELMRSQKVAGEEAFLHEHLEKEPSGALRTGASYLKGAKLEPEILGLFPTREGDSDEEED